MLEDFRGKNAKDVKNAAAAELGISALRQRFLSQDGARVIEDDEVLSGEMVTLQLVKLEYLPPNAEEDGKMASAARDNDLVALNELLRCPRDPNVTDDTGRTASHHAAEHGHVEAMQLLLSAGARMDARDMSMGCWAPLHVACHHGQLAILRLLIEAGVDINMATSDGETPVDIAARDGQEKILRILIEADVDPQRASPRDGFLPLHVAAVHNHPEVVCLLLWERVDADTPTRDGWTALQLAARNGNMAVVRKLVGFRLYWWFQQHVFSIFFPMLGCFFSRIAGFFFRSTNHPGLDIDKATQHGTALFLAAAEGHAKVVRLLIHCKADVEKGGPLRVAMLNRDDEVAALLREAGADVAAAEG